MLKHSSVLLLFQLITAVGLAQEHLVPRQLFNAVNFMDGRRTTAEIAELLSAKYEEEIDQAWVDRLVGILASRKLVSLK